MLSQNLNKLCRVCMLEGSREIFNQTVPTTSSSSTTEIVSSPNRLLEKLRYVTLIKVNFPFFLYYLNQGHKLIINT